MSTSGVSVRDVVKVVNVSSQIHSNPATGDVPVLLSVHGALSESSRFNVKKENGAHWFISKALGFYFSGTWFESRAVYRVS